MSLTNFLRKNIYNYLGYRGIEEDPSIDKLIDECYKILKRKAHFRWKHAKFTSIPIDIYKEPYISFLKDCTCFHLTMYTLGDEVDKEIQLLSYYDPLKSFVLDACANAYLEFEADERDKLFGENRTYRFCPGYGGSSVEDIRKIVCPLKYYQLGVRFNECNIMSPSKTMVGIIGIGKKSEKNCDNRFMIDHCHYRKENTRCYNK